MIWCIYVVWRCMSTCMEWCSWAWAGQHILCLLDKRSWIHRFTKWIAFCCASHWMSNSVWWGAAWMIGTAGWKSLGDDSNSGTTFPVATAERSIADRLQSFFRSSANEHICMILHVICPKMFFDTPFSSTPDSRKCHFEEFISVPLKLKEVAEKIETGLELLGITGIEDKLQVGVPATWPHNWYWLYRWLHVSLPWAPVGTALIQGCHWKATGGHKGFEVQSCRTVSPLDIFGGNWICGVNVLNLKWLVWSKMI